MSQVWIRPIRENEYALLATYLYEGRAKNRFRPEIFLRKQVRVYVAFNESGILGFLPVAAVYLCESLAFRPDITPLEEAKALRAFQVMLVEKAYEQNVPDAFFCTYDTDLQKFVQSYGWEKVTSPFYTLQFSKLEPKEE